jgi:hypothetical protein
MSQVRTMRRMAQLPAGTVRRLGGDSLWPALGVERDSVAVFVRRPRSVRSLNQA